MAERRDPAGLGDLARQVKVREPGRRDRARQRRAGGFGARSLVAARVVRIGRDVAVEIGPARDKAVGVIGKCRTARRRVGCAGQRPSA